MTYGFRSAVLTRTHWLPGSRAALKVTEGLGELEGLNNDALLLLVVAQLSITSQGEVLAQWVAIEAVIGHDTTQIRVAGEEHTEHVVNLTLVPQSTLEETSHTGHRGGLVRVGLDTNTGVVANTEQVVDDLEALVAGREVDTRDIGDLGELGGSVVLEEAHHGNNSGGSGVHCELILPDCELLDIFGQTGHNILPIGVKAVGHGLVLVGRVDYGGA
jgi:hypothetical protein